MKINGILKRLLALVVISAASAWPLASHAALLEAKAFTNTDYFVSDRDVSSLDSVEASAGAPWSTEDGSTADAVARGDQDGGMYAYAHLSGEFGSWSTISQTIEIVNDTGADQNYFYDFNILSGELLFNVSSSYEYGEYLRAGNEIHISLDGVDLFYSEAVMTVRGGASLDFSLRKRGFELSPGGVIGGRYRWGEYSDTLDLGVIRAGQTVKLEYDIRVFTEGSLVEGHWACTLECGTEAWSVFGDPNLLHKSPMTAAQLTHKPVSPVSVPEPSLWLLMGTGLFGFAVARRRKVAKA